MPASVAAAITFGAEEETFLALGPEDTRAIVRLHDGTSAVGSTCTATLIRQDWLITAAHCLRIEPLVISTAGQKPLEVEVQEVVEHPELDVSLLRVAAGALEPARPMALNELAPDAAWVGERVELVGYGLDERGELDGLRFAVESVSDVAESSIGVHGRGRSGACLGDSGGPLLIRDRRGRPAIAGILSTGSESCRHHDTYVRVDLILEWVKAVAGEEAVDVVACGSIDERGGCWFGNALACVGGVLDASVCEAGTSCGWDAALARFVCVVPSSDPCQGAGSAGVCLGDVARRCDAGAVSEQACGPCHPCRYAPTTGEPECPPQ